jgi:hypothetical protein
MARASAAAERSEWSGRLKARAVGRAFAFERLTLALSGLCQAPNPNVVHLERVGISGRK